MPHTNTSNTSKPTPPQAQQLALCLDSGIPGEIHRALNTLSVLSSDPVTPLSLQAPHTAALLPPLLRVLAGVDDGLGEGYVFAVDPSVKGVQQLVRGVCCFGLLQTCFTILGNTMCCVVWCCVVHCFGGCSMHR